MPCGPLPAGEAADADDLGIEDFLDKGSWPSNGRSASARGGSGIKVTLEVVGEEERTIVMEVEDAGRAQVWRHFRGEP